MALSCCALRRWSSSSSHSMLSKHPGPAGASAVVLTWSGPKKAQLLQKTLHQKTLQARIPILTWHCTSRIQEAEPSFTKRLRRWSCHVLWTKKAQLHQKTREFGLRRPRTLQSQEGRTSSNSASSELAEFDEVRPPGICSLSLFYHLSLVFQFSPFSFSHFFSFLFLSLSLSSYALSLSMTMTMITRSVGSLCTHSSDLP